MITPQDSVMADHEVESLGKDWVLVREFSVDWLYEYKRHMMQYQVIAGPWKILDVVTLDTLIKAGLRVEVIG